MWSALAKTETTTSTLKCFQGPRFNPQLWLQSVWSLRSLFRSPMWVSSGFSGWQPTLWKHANMPVAELAALLWLSVGMCVTPCGYWKWTYQSKMWTVTCLKPWPHPTSALIRPSQRSDIAFLRTWKTLKNHTTKHVGVNELSNFQSVESAKGSQSALHCCLANFLKLMFFHRPPEIYPSHASNDISLKNLLGRVWALPKQSPALWNGLTCL